METINNMATAAAKAVWGENTKDGQEPISGETGNTTKGEPYDKGNIDEPNSTTNTAAKSTSATDTAEPPKTTSGSTDEPTSTEFAKTTGTAAESSSIPATKQTELKAKDTPADTTKGQNDVRDPEDPQTHPANQPTDVDNTSSGISKGQEPEGAGPKPLDEVAKQHGGDAGKSDTNVTYSGGDSGKKEGSNDPNDPRAESTGEGTGEKYIKSTGLAADGGDFDATKPGAGREADRLLEEKGIHVEKGTGSKGAGPSETSVNSGGSGDKEKKSLKDKIKDKLHRH